jgi:transposase
MDYAGHTVPGIDTCAGKIRKAQICVAVLGGFNYNHAEAIRSQALPDWVASHQRTFGYLEGVQ